MFSKISKKKVKVHLESDNDKILALSRSTFQPSKIKLEPFIAFSISGSITELPVKDIIPSRTKSRIEISIASTLTTGLEFNHCI